MITVLNALAAADKELRQKQVQALNELAEASENLPWDDWWNQNGRFFGKEGEFQQTGESAVSVGAASKDPLDFVLLGVEHMDKEYQSYDIMELLTEAAAIHYRAGRNTTGDSVLSKSLYLARTQGSHGLVKCALQHIANKLIDCGKTDGVKAYLEEAEKEAYIDEDKRWRARSVADLANSYISLGNDKKALSLLEDASKLIDIIDYPYWEVDTYCGMAHIYAKLGKRDEGLALLWKALNVSVNVDGLDSVGSALSSVVDGYARFGETERALKIAETIFTPMMRHAAFYHVASALLQGGHVEKALEVARRCEDRYCEAEMLLDIAEANIGDNEHDKALKRLAAAERLLGRVEDEDSRVRVKVRIGTLYHRAGKKQEASEMLRAIPHRYTDWFAIWLAAEALAEIGDYDDAIKSACKLTEKNRRVETLAKVALHMAKDRTPQSEEKEQLLASMIAALEGESGR